MIGFFCSLFLSLIVALVFASQGSYLPLPVQNQKKPVDEKFHKFWEKKVLDGLLRYDYDYWFKKFLDFPANLEETFGSAFSCPNIVQHSKPATVHRLTPKDIGVVAALGDSATSGFGARSSGLRDLFVEFRGIAWSIGGDGSVDQVLTLPNILKKYNPSIVGYSTKVTRVSDRNKHFSGNNFAKTGATAEEMAEAAEELISHLKENGEFALKNKWKVLTIFIGEQDLCMSCFERDYAAKNFIKKISKTLEKIKEKLPRVFVNLVQVYDVTNFHEMSSTYCRAFLKVTCPCVAAGPEQREYVSRTARQYQRLLKILVRSPKFRDTQDFAVVLQPFLMNSFPPRRSNGMIDYSYFAPDCFHLSAKGHAAMTTALWNSMLEPVGYKPTAMVVNDTLNCPRPNFPYFFTKRNSIDYQQINGPIFNFHKQKNKFSLNSNVQLKESEKKGMEHEQEKHHRPLGIAIGGGLAVAAVAVGVAMLLVKKRERATGRIAREEHRNYNSCDQETLL